MFVQHLCPMLHYVRADKWSGDCQTDACRPSASHAEQSATQLIHHLCRTWFRMRCKSKTQMPIGCGGSCTSHVAQDPTQIANHLRRILIQCRSCIQSFASRYVLSHRCPTQMVVPGSMEIDNSLHVLYISGDIQDILYYG